MDYQKIMGSSLILKREKVKELMKAEKKLTKTTKEKTVKKSKDPLVSWGVSRFLNYRKKVMRWRKLK